MKRIVFVVTALVFVALLQGCGVARMAQGIGTSIGINKGVGAVQNLFAGKATVEDELPQVADNCDQNADKPAIWDCRRGDKAGALFVIFNNEDGKSLENDKQSRKLAREIKSGLPPGYRVEKDVRLQMAPIFQEAQQASSGVTAGVTGTAYNHFTGRWIVIVENTAKK